MELQMIKDLKRLDPDFQLLPYGYIPEGGVITVTFFYRGITQNLKFSESGAYASSGTPASRLFFFSLAEHIQKRGWDWGRTEDGMEVLVPLGNGTAHYPSSGSSEESNLLQSYVQALTERGTTV